MDLPVYIVLIYKNSMFPICKFFLSLETYIYIFHGEKNDDDDGWPVCSILHCVGGICMLFIKLQQQQQQHFQTEKK